MKVGVGGEALSALAVYVYSYPSFSLVASGNANAVGTFSFAEIPYGEYYVYFPRTTSQLFPPGGSFVSLANASYALGDIPVYVPNRTISGRLHDEFGDPATAWTMNISTFIGGWYYSRGEPVQPDGSYTIGAIDASWDMNASLPVSGAPPREVFIRQLTLSGTDATGINATVTISSANYTAWLQQHSLSGAPAKPATDPDRDGFNNQTEFAFGTDPNVPDGSLFHISSHEGSFIASGLVRTNDLSYFVRGSTNLNSWTAAEGVTVADDPSEPAPPEGYAKKQLTVNASGKKFFRLLATDKPELVPDETFSIKVAGEPVTVERWGTGPKAVVFFGYIPFTMADDLKNQSASDFRTLAGSEYSMFLWTYPGNVAPFSQAMTALYSYGVSSTPQDRLALSGIASSVVSQVRSATGLQDVCLVGNSFGAGVVLWDLASLSADTKVRFVLISPTEAFIPPSAPAAIPLPHTILVADAERDDWFYHQADIDYIKLRTNGLLPPGYVPGSSAPHLIIGQSASLPYVFGLISQAFALQ